MPPDGLNIRWPDTPLRAGDAAARVQAHGRARLRPRQQARPRDHRRPERGASASSPPASPISTCARRSTISASTTTDAGAARPRRLQGRHDLAARARGRARSFAEGLEEILVVEEKRAADREPAQGALYQLAGRPAAAGRRQARRAAASRSCRRRRARRRRASPAVIVARIARFDTERGASSDRLAVLEAQGAGARAAASRRSRACPTSAPAARTTPRPRCRRASRALAGIGCHYMAQWMDRNTDDLHPDGRRRRDLGRRRRRSPTTPHVFQNLGDGTYFHSGLLAIRAAIAADANITYKILYNDAVAMTGGQPIDGPLDVAEIARQVHAEGVEAHRRRERRAGEVSGRRRLPAGRHRPPPRRARRGAARAARDRRASRS